MFKQLMSFLVIAGVVLAMAPAAQATVVAITSVSATTTGTVGDPQTIILDSFTAGGTFYTTATDLVTGTSVDTDGHANPGQTIGDQDNFDFNSYFSRGGNSADRAWTTTLFGGGNWSNTNGDDEDFFIFEAGGNDTISVRAIFTDDTVGQSVVLSTKLSEGGPVIWGDTNVAITEGARAGSNIFGLGFAITDLVDAGGVALTNSAVIKGLDFDGPNTDIASISAVAVTEAVTVPEPATATLAMLGLGGLMMRRRRQA
jgi:hypothetical protein